MSVLYSPLKWKRPEFKAQAVSSQFGSVVTKQALSCLVYQNPTRNISNLLATHVAAELRRDPACRSIKTRGRLDPEGSQDSPGLFPPRPDLSRKIRVQVARVGSFFFKEEPDQGKKSGVRKRALLAKSLTLQACAVNILRHHPDVQDEGELVELIKRLALRRGISWQYGHELTDVLERAKRYEVQV